MTIKLLLLAGTSEARQLAALLSDRSIDTTASLKGITKRPIPYPVATRVGNFGGRERQQNYTCQEKFTHVIDASHPFASRIATRTYQIAQDLGLPYLRVLRPSWRAGPDDQWHFIDAPVQAVRLIPRSSRVMLATGAESILDWKKLANGRELFCRRVEATNAPFPFEGDWITGRPPFSLAAEKHVLDLLAIDWLVVKNSGGPTSAKLIAAREANCPVIMLTRPKYDRIPFVETVEEALAWVNSKSE